MIRILIADDSTAILDGLSSLLSPHPDFEVIGTARDGLEAMEKTSQLIPDVIIMDARMPNMDGIEATRHIKRAFPEVGIVFLSVFADCLEASIAAGADVYLRKDCGPEQLFSEVRRGAANTD